MSEDWEIEGASREEEGAAEDEDILGLRATGNKPESESESGEAGVMGIGEMVRTITGLGTFIGPAM